MEKISVLGLHVGLLELALSITAMTIPITLASEPLPPIIVEFYPAPIFVVPLREPIDCYLLTVSESIRRTESDNTGPMTPSIVHLLQLAF